MAGRSDIVITIGGDTSDFTRAWSKTESEVSRGTEKLTRSFSGLRTAFAGVFAAGAAREILEIADTYTLLRGKLQLVTESTEELEAVQAALYTSANNVRTSYEAQADLFARVARSTERFNITQKQTLEFTDAISRSMVVAGQSTEEAAAFAIQFGQALASNRLGGDEFRSVMESNARAVKVLTDYLQIDIGELRNWAKEGKLTTAVIYNAFAASAEKLKEEAESMPKTVAQSMAHLKNAGKDLIDQVNQQSDATRSLGSALDDLAVKLETNRDGLVTTFSDMAAGAIKAAEEIAGIVVPIANVAGEVGNLLGFESGDWGIIGTALLVGGPQAAALTAALATINSQLKQYNLNLGSLVSTSREFGDASQNMWDVVTGKRDWNTGAWLTPAKDDLESLKKKAAELESQISSAGGKITDFGSILNVAATGGAAYLEQSLEKVNNQIATTQSVNDYLGGLSGVGFDINNLVVSVDDLGSSNVSASNDMGKLEEASTKAGASHKKLTTNVKAAATAIRTEQNAALQEILASMRNYIDASKDGSQATADWINSAQDAADGMRDLNKEYATTGLDEYSAVMVGLDQRFSDGMEAVTAFQTRLQESNGKVAEAKRQYDAAREAVSQYTAEVSKNGAKSGARDAKDLKAINDLLEEKAQRLQEAQDEQAALNAVNESGAMTEENLREAVYNSKESLKEQRAAMVEAAKAGNDFFDGFSAGAISMQDDMATMGQVGFEVFGALRDGWRDGVYDIFTGDFESLGDVWDSMLNRMLKAFTDWIADLIFQWAASEIASVFSGSGGSGFDGIVGGIVSALSNSGGGSGGGSSSAVGSLASAAANKIGGTGAAQKITTGITTAINGGPNTGPTAITSVGGSALGAVGGAYGLYNTYQQIASGDANWGTALQGGLSAYSLYNGVTGLYESYQTAQALAAIKASLAAEAASTSGTTTVVSGIGAETTSGLSAGLSAAGPWGAALAAVITAAQFIDTSHAQEIFTGKQTGINIQTRDYGWDQENDIRKHQQLFAQDPTKPGNQSLGINPVSLDMNKIFANATREAAGILDILANQFGDAIAQLGTQMDGSAASVDSFLDSATGYDVSMQTSTSVTDLAARAANGNHQALGQLRGTLEGLGLSSDDADTAITALIATTGGAADAVSGMTTAINALSNTPLNIKVNVMGTTMTVASHSAINTDTSQFAGGFDVGGSIGSRIGIHAAGGVFGSSTLIPSLRGGLHVVGEAGKPEAITPLHAGPDTLKKMHDDILALKDMQVVNNFYVDGKQIATQIMPTVDAHVVAKSQRGQLGSRTVWRP